MQRARGNRARGAQPLPALCPAQVAALGMALVLPRGRRGVCPGPLGVPTPQGGVPVQAPGAVSVRWLLPPSSGSPNGQRRSRAGAFPASLPAPRAGFWGFTLCSGLSGAQPSYRSHSWPSVVAACLEKLSGTAQSQGFTLQAQCHGAKTHLLVLPCPLLGFGVSGTSAPFSPSWCHCREQGLEGRKVTLKNSRANPRGCS